MSDPAKFIRPGENGYDDEKRPVNVAWPVENEPKPPMAEETELSPEEQLAELLEGLRASKPDREELDDLIDSISEQKALRIATTYITNLLVKLDNTAGGVALKKVIFKNESKSLRKYAKACKHSHVAIYLAEKTIRERIAKTTPPLTKRSS